MERIFTGMSNGIKTSDIEQKYVDMTGSVFLSEINPDEKHILRQIAYNIAHLADEVRALRHDIESIDIEVEQETEDEEEPEENEGDIVYCFHCGKKMKVREAASTVIATGRKRYLCKACDKDIDSFIKDFLFH